MDPNRDRLCRCFRAWNSQPYVAHSTLRDFEKIFPEYVYFNGVPFFPWTSIAGLCHVAPRGLAIAVRDYFQGERLLVEAGQENILSYGLITRGNARPEQTYLRLEFALMATTTILPHLLTLKVRFFLSTEAPNVVFNPIYRVYRGPFVSGVLYERPPPGTSGVYLLLCGPASAFTTGRYSSPSFIMKVGKSVDMDQRFDQHVSPNAIYRAGGVLDFIFGLEIPHKYIHDAERMLLVKLTALGFFWPIMTETGLRTQETFAFTEKSLCLIHDVV